MSDLEAVFANIEFDLAAAYERLLVRVRSISTDPAYAQQCGTCANWLVHDLRDIGFATTINKR